MNDVHTGGCACGAVRYETRGEPRRVSICACTWCQRRTGSAFGISVYFDKGGVAFTHGSLQKCRFRSDAGRWLESEFCIACGTTVTWTLEYWPDYRGIAGGTFDQPTFWCQPERIVFARSKPDWLGLPDGIEIHETLPGARRS